MVKVNSVDIQLKKTWEKLKCTVDYDVGIIKMLLPGVLAPGDPPIYSYAGVMANTKAYGLHQCNQRNGGAGFSELQARVSAIGECLERYCAAFYKPEQFTLASWEEIKSNALHPDKWALFSDKQYELFKTLGWNFVPFKTNTKVKWTQGWSLINNCSTFVPAQMVYIPYLPDKNESVISPSISTGMAYANSFLEAICYGLYEQFERDAFTLWWLWRLPLPNLDISHPLISELCNIFSTSISKFWVKYLSLDFKVHVICVLGLASIRMPTGERKKILVMGSAARLDPIRALKKAFLEMGQAAPFYRYLLDRNPNKEFSSDLRDLWDFDDHAYYWLLNTEKHLPHLDFLEKGEKINFDSLANFDSGDTLNNVEFMLGELKKKKMEAVVVDLTTNDIRKIGGMICKVLIPQFQPLEGAHFLRHLGSRRLWSIPKELGYFSKLDETQLNPLPHPSP